RHTRFSRDWSSDVCSSDLVECHEFYDRLKTMRSSTNCNARKTKLSNRCIDNTFSAEFVKHTLAHFVSTVILSYFFTHQKYSFIFAHFFVQCFTKRFSELYFSH